MISNVITSFEENSVDVEKFASFKLLKVLKKKNIISPISNDLSKISKMGKE